MAKLALLGAGGKMGVRLSKNLAGSRFDVAHVEVSEEGRQRLKAETGIDCVPLDDALSGAEIIILAVPDRLIGKVLHTFVEKVPSNDLVIMLDAAAPHAGELPERADITYFVTHPCHPPLFNDETTPEAQADHFGGVHAKQHIVCALMQGPEEHYALGEELARIIFQPVMNAHRVTVEQMAILEPALSESVACAFALVLREATEEAIRRGVPRQAAVDFLMGHLNIGLAVAFEYQPGGKFSDGAIHAIEQARPVIFREGWMEKIFSPEAVMKSVQDICNPPKPS